MTSFSPSGYEQNKQLDSIVKSNATWSGQRRRTSASSQSRSLCPLQHALRTTTLTQTNITKRWGTKEASQATLKVSQGLSRPAHPELQTPDQAGIRRNYQRGRWKAQFQAELQTNLQTGSTGVRRIRIPEHMPVERESETNFPKYCQPPVRFDNLGA